MTEPDFDDLDDPALADWLRTALPEAMRVQQEPGRMDEAYARAQEAIRQHASFAEFVGALTDGEFLLLLTVGSDAPIPLLVRLADEGLDLIDDLNEFQLAMRGELMRRVRGDAGQ